MRKFKKKRFKSYKKRFNRNAKKGMKKVKKLNYPKMSRGGTRL